jgi:hypothetical protein
LIIHHNLRDRNKTLSEKPVNHLVLPENLSVNSSYPIYVGINLPTPVVMLTVHSEVLSRNTAATYQNLISSTTSIQLLWLQWPTRMIIPHLKKQWQVLGPDAGGFITAMEAELVTLIELNVFDIVERNSSMKVLSVVWALKRKRYPDGYIRKLTAFKL